MPLSNRKYFTINAHVNFSGKKRKKIAKLGKNGGDGESVAKGVLKSPFFRNGREKKESKKNAIQLFSRNDMKNKVGKKK